MQRIGGKIILSPTDLTKHQACRHISTLDLALANDDEDAPRPALPDDSLDLIFRKGLEHESRYLQRLQAQGHRVVEIPTVFDDWGRRKAEAQTIEAMRSGADVVYQGTFYDGTWGGQADFLIRRELTDNLRSEWGSYAYDIADTKLARRLKVPALLQMATYAERLTTLQGLPPETLYVVTGDGAERAWRLRDVDAYARRARTQLRGFVERPRPTEPVPVPHCSQCRWNDNCTEEWEANDDLSLVAGMRRGAREQLRIVGITNTRELSTKSAGDLPSAMSEALRERLTVQARLQVAERDTGTPSYQLLDPEPGRGLLRLPPPSAGDLYLDFEGDPFADNGREDGEGLEYLAGLGDAEGRFVPLWAHDAAQEKSMTENLVDSLIERWDADPGMHVYHYANYEVAALKKLTARHGTREAELDRLLRGERFVDLYAVVREGLRISKSSYSIKYLEAYYWGDRRSGDDVATAIGSVVAYEQWLLERKPEQLESIRAYNEVDVQSTRALQLWLEGLREELQTAHGEQPRPELSDGQMSEQGSESVRQEQALEARALAAGQPLLAGMVSWHRRESRPRFWDLHRLDSLDDDQLVRDSAALGELSAPTWAGEEKRSTVWRYEFPPQDTKIRPGRVIDVDTASEVPGTVTEVHADEGYLLLKLGNGRQPSTVRGFGPPGPPVDKVLREAVHAAAEEILGGGEPLAAAVLSRRVPPHTAVRDGETAAEAVVRVGRALDGQVLAVQGPPGSGKTTVGAELIRALLDDGKTVGVTGLSHAVIGNLLSAVGRPALQKCPQEEWSGDENLRVAKDNDAVVNALAHGSARLIGGTAWLWAREEMQEKVDVLVVDEAGQFSLANTLAVARGAKSLVLLGDPQQLAQPSQAHHPYGAGVSALEHLLDGEATVPPDRGVFLDRTYRMHPSITSAVSEMAYENRLASAPGLDRQGVVAPGRLTGSGLRFVPVEHTGNEAASGEEAAEVAALYADLLRGRWTDSSGKVRPLTAEDILVVAPFNAHVGRLRAALPPGARVGTVDKFQGRQAAVVLYSMASSSAADAPRGVNFLYDLHRFNVALSRAKALVAVVASPTLLDAAVHSPEQLRAVNALCRYAEEAARAPQPPVRAVRPRGGAGLPVRHGTAAMPNPAAVPGAMSVRAGRTGHPDASGRRAAGGGSR